LLHIRRIAPAALLGGGEKKKPESEGKGWNRGFLFPPFGKEGRRKRRALSDSPPFPVKEVLLGRFR